MKKILSICTLIFMMTMFSNIGYSQCTMCKTTAENSVKGENTAGLGLNDGIALLIAVPYLSAGLLGFIWYRSYRNKMAGFDKE